MIILFIVLWLAAGLLSSGLYFATFQRGYGSIRNSDFYSDRANAAVTIIFGPVSLIVSILMGGAGHGWLWPWGKKAKMEAGIK